MSKNFNYNYYGVETTVWPSNGDNVASMVGRNTWYYYDGGYNPSSANAPNWGKPYDPSVAIWRLEKEASYANKGYVCILPGDNLNVEVKLAETDSTVPLIMQATTGAESTASTGALMDWATGGRIDKRLGYDTSWDNNSLWSRLCYDINPQMFCLFPAIQCYNKTSNGITGCALTAYGNTNRLRTWIDADPDNREVSMIRYDMYFGGNDAVRSTVGQFITQSVDRPTDNQKPCVPLCEPYCDCPLPDYQPIKDAIREVTQQSPEGHPDWEASKIFNPFIMSPRRFWYDSSTYNSYNQFYTIGFNLSINRNDYRNGYQIVRDKDGWPIGNARITAQWIRGNFGRKDFDDVSYHWRWYIWDGVNKLELQNGFNLNNLSTNSNIRVMTELVIDDYKGQTKGEALERAVKHETAYTGFWFAQSPTLSASGTLNETSDGVGIFLPKRVNGIPNGEYYTGEEIADAPEAKEQSTDDWYNDGDINPISGDVGEFRTTTHTGFAPNGGTTYWLCTETMINDIIDYINKYSTSDSRTEIEPPPDDLDYSDPESVQAWRLYMDAKAGQTEIDWQGVDPWQYITSLKWYPFTPPKYPNTTDTVHLGPLDLNVTTDKLLQTTSLQRMASFNLTRSNPKMPYYGNWRDYDCDITLMLPFIGSVELDPALYIGHTVNVDYIFDWRIGTVTAYISRDNFIVDSRSGTCGADIPLSLASAGSYQNAIRQIEAAKTQSSMSTAGSIAGTALAVFGNMALAVATGGASIPAQIAIGATIGGITSGIKVAEYLQTEEQLDYQLGHTPVQMGSVSSADPLANTAVDWRVQLLIAYPTSTADDTIYAKTVGYACCRQGTLDDFSGFVACSTVNLDSLSCTKQEAQLIREQLQAGIINN